MQTLLVMLFAAGTSLPQQGQAAVHAPTVSAPASAISEKDALGLAARMVAASPALTRIWPGFWPANQPFVINLPDHGAFLIAPGAPPPDWEPVAPTRLPPALRGRAFFRAGAIAGASRPFITDFSLGDGRKAIFVNADDDVTHIAALLLHEQFHVFQGNAFKGRNRQFVAPDAIADRVAFAAAAELERRILAAALRAGPAEQRRLLRSYFAVRAEREDALPAEVREVEHTFERSEGTARYIDRTAHAALFGGDVEMLLIEDLRGTLLKDTGAFTTIWFRRRSYSTGAALTYLLSRFQPVGWRAQIEAGGDPAALLKALIAPHATPAEAVRGARERFGYRELLRQMRPVIEAGAKAEIKNEGEFLALGSFALTIELPPRSGDGAAMRPTFSASDMAFLTQSAIVLRKADSFTMSGVGTEIVVRSRPVLTDSRANRVVVLLDGPPAIDGLGAPAPGARRLDRLRIDHGGLALRHDSPVEVLAEGAGKMTIRLLPPQ